jgi:chromosome partitioning protein
MIDRRTTQSEEFVTSLKDTYGDIVGPQIVQTANIGTFQTAGKTLFAVNDDELYQTGRKACDAYAQATEQLLGVSQ